jgi:hypothetical protein
VQYAFCMACNLVCSLKAVPHSRPKFIFIQLESSGCAIIVKMDNLGG